MLIECVVAAVLAPQEPAVPGLAEASTEPPFTLVIADPGTMVRQCVEGWFESGASLPDGMQAGPDKDIVAALAEFGAKWDDPATWSLAGLDSKRSWRLSFADPGFLYLPKSSWVTFGVTDRGLAQRFMARVNGEPESDGGQPPIYEANRTAWCIRGREAFALTTTVTGSTSARRLRGAVEHDAGSATIGSDALFRMMMRRIDGVARAAAYLNIERLAPGEGPCRAVLLTLTDRVLEIGFAPRDNSALFGSARPGGECRQVLERFEKPVLALSTSLASPAGSLLGLEQEGVLDREAEAAVERAKLLLGKNLLDQLENTALGLLIYPRNGSLDDPQSVLCVRVADPSRALKSIRDVWPTSESELVPAGDWMKAEIGGKGLYFGAIGDCIVVGDAIEAMRRAATNEQRSWSTSLGDKSLFRLEVDVLAAALASGFEGDAGEVAMLEEAGILAVEALRQEQGFVVRIEMRGTQTDKSLLRRLISVIGATWSL